MTDFLTDVKSLRDKARQDIMKGPVTASYGTDVTKVVDLLNVALATEIVCVLRYRQHHFTATGLNSEPVAAEFLTHSVEEQDHADRLAARIVQLGGTPKMDPAGLEARAHSEYKPASDLQEMVKENLVAERIAVASYTEMINWVGTADPTTRRVLEDILAKEEEHADDMLSLLES
ncbi:Ferritin Dps family protein [Catenulispora acidiphila DSM 44928]|uniref:Ferritin Dps family protein n=1 Tax=Catenulispora acidiphila (strain DSM 44928 / JCM 14897 / NBRC 102108 / NRRL B-24433 / ID139908) TaxID=479433 RepID=C7PWJ8_CATAD|nr:ferritin-like domain-containing protein [Catenulispora acidiphila]ACU75278.1 Ferritin Dps family protein [Catenulispora acidiphila DSM 44928]